MASGRSDNRFSKTRSDHLTERAEDYVEAIAELSGGLAGQSCRVGELASLLEVSHVTVVQALARLETRGLVKRAPRGPVGLTAEGRRMARDARERHEVVLAFLLWLGVPRKAAERDAEGMEHHVSDETLARMRMSLAGGHTTGGVLAATRKSSTAGRPSDVLREAVKQRSSRGRSA